ncbi:MAG: hypothetical protein ACYDAY_06040 [Candidatus Dormibacteria bacterium]
MVATGGRYGYGFSSDFNWGISYSDPSGTKFSQQTYGPNLSRPRIDFFTGTPATGITGKEIGGEVVLCGEMASPDDYQTDDPTYGDYVDFSCGDNQGYDSYRASLVMTSDPPGTSKISTTVGVYDCEDNLAGTFNHATITFYGFDGANYNVLDTGTDSYIYTQVSHLSESCTATQPPNLP